MVWCHFVNHWWPRCLPPHNTIALHVKVNIRHVIINTQHTMRFRDFFKAILNKISNLARWRSYKVIESLTTHLFSIERADWLKLHGMFKARDAKIGALLYYRSLSAKFIISEYMNCGSHMDISPGMSFNTNVYILCDFSLQWYTPCVGNPDLT